MNHTETYCEKIGEHISCACTCHAKTEANGNPFDRLLNRYKVVLQKVYPDVNLKPHADGCTCEICEVELALGNKKVGRGSK